MKKGLANKSIHKYSIFIVFIVLFAAIYVAYIIDVEKNLFREAEIKISEETEDIANIFGIELMSSLEEVVSISYSLSEKALYKNEVIEFLKFYSDKNNYLRFSYYDLEGNLTGTDNVTGNISDTYSFKRNLEGFPAISKPTTDTAGEHRVIVFSAPVPLNGKMEYGISGARYLDSVVYNLSRDFFYGNGYSFITDGNGEVLVAPSNTDFDETINNYVQYVEAESNNAKLSATLIDDMKKGNSGAINYSINKSKKIVSYAPIKGVNDWYVFCVIPDYRSTDIQRKIVFNLFGMFTLGVVSLLVIFGYIFSLNKKATERLEVMAYTDSLTGKRNLNKFKMEANEIIKSGFSQKSLALVALDINNFKIVNELFGFDVGDKVLIEVANALEDSMNEDEIFARIANDDFVFLSRFKDSDELSSRGYMLQYLLQEEQKLLLPNHKLSFNIGIYKLEEQVDIMLALEKAGMAVQHARQLNSKVPVFYDDSMREKALLVSEIENSMIEALQNKEFVVYLQPKFNLAKGIVEGAEALIRWNHPEKGLISPMEFIPLFEKNGFIIHIDLFVLEEVCKLQRKFIDEGKQLIPISINQSKVLINCNDYIDTVIEIVQRYEVPAHLIELELTETVVHDNIKMLKGVTSKLQDQGFLISIDDFGTGYSSLNLLKELNVDVLKIDQEFLSNFEVDQRSHTVLEGIIKLAKELEILVVTEGVETSLQADLLKLLNCDMAQGYLYAKPMSISEFEKYLDEQRR